MRFNKNTEKYNTAELTAQAYRAQVSGNRTKKIGASKITAVASL